MRYLTGLPFDESEVTGSGDSGKFLVGLEDVWVVADSRYTIAVKRDAPDSTLYEANTQLADFWADLVATAGVRRVAIEAMTIPHLTWEKLREAAPDVELVRDRGLGRGGPAAARSHPSWSGSRRRRRSPTGRSRRSCRRSGRA